MQSKFEPTASKVQEPIHRLSIVGADRAETKTVTSLDNGIDYQATLESMHYRVTLRADEPGAIGSSKARAQEMLRALNKTKMILDARRSQLKKMQQLSKIRFISKIISKDYLNELADDLIWYEAALQKATNDLDQLNAASEASPEIAFPPASIPTTG